MKKISFVDLNKSLVEKAQQLFDKHKNNKW